MQKIYKSVNNLDKRCYEELSLSEDLLMEHAANSIALYIKKSFLKDSKILIVCGGGNNGADGLALARILEGDYRVVVAIIKEPKSKMAKLQLERAKKAQVEIVYGVCENRDFDVVVDAIFGSGFEGELPEDIKDVILRLNALECEKIACDIPTGVNLDGVVSSVAFMATKTITMGSLKLALYLDMAKDYVGDIEVANLGISRSLYELPCEDAYLLEQRDLVLPYRAREDTHKGSFGHLAIISGSKCGASLISAISAFRFGASLVTIVGKRDSFQSIEIMSSCEIPANATAIAVGMGLGVRSISDSELLSISKIPALFDADIFYHQECIELIKISKNIVLTPHPKEFSTLCKNLDFGDFDVEYIQKNRFLLAREFSITYPGVVLVLKGANTIVAQNGKIYINPLGSSALSKGGMGDLLSGLISALLAQGYSPLDASIAGTLSMCVASQKIKKANYALTPLDIVEALCNIKEEPQINKFKKRTN